MRRLGIIHVTLYYVSYMQWYIDCKSCENQCSTWDGVSSMIFTAINIGSAGVTQISQNLVVDQILIRGSSAKLKGVYTPALYQFAIKT